MNQTEFPTRWNRRWIGGKRNILSLLLLMAWTLSGCNRNPGAAVTNDPTIGNPPTTIAVGFDPSQTSGTPDMETSSSPTLVFTNAITEPPPASLTPQVPTPTLLQATLTPTATARWVRPTFTASATPEAPLAAIQILGPGEGSRVISPIQVSVYLEPGAKGNIRFELLGEDGRLLARTIKTYFTGARVHANLDLEYEINAAAEAGRLQISTEDSYGRTIALASVDLLLLSIGDEDINQPGDQTERVIIEEPQPKKLIQGGLISVSGLARLPEGTPLLVELLKADGKPLGATRMASLSAPRPDGYSTFQVEMAYEIKSPTWVRLTVYELGGRITGIVHLNSVEVFLSP